MKRVKLTKLGKKVKKILNIILVLLLLFNVSKPVKADIETDISFKGFNIENISTMSTTDWPSFSQETLFDNLQHRVVMKPNSPRFQWRK